MYQIKNENEIYLYDDVTSGVTAREVIKALKESTGPVTLRINSHGGDGFEAIALYNVLKNYSVTVYVDGICASAASIIAMAGRVIMPSNSMMMIHNPAGMVTGESEDMRKLADVLDKIRDSIAEIYASKTGLGHDEIIEMMKAESWMTGAEAKALGFADEITGEIMNTSAQSFDDGVRAERERLKALDSLNAPGREGIIARAKYETFKNASEIAIDLLKAKSTTEIYAVTKPEEDYTAVAKIINKARGY